MNHKRRGSWCCRSRRSNTRRNARQRAGRNKDGALNFSHLGVYRTTASDGGRRSHTKCADRRRRVRARRGNVPGEGGADDLVLANAQRTPQPAALLIPCYSTLATTGRHRACRDGDWTRRLIASPRARCSAWTSLRSEGTSVLLRVSMQPHFAMCAHCAALEPH